MPDWSNSDRGQRFLLRVPPSTAQNRKGTDEPQSAGAKLKYCARRPWIKNPASGRLFSQPRAEPM
jgi:hypothetical protein